MKWSEFIISIQRQNERIWERKKNDSNKWVRFYTVTAEKWIANA